MPLLDLAEFEVQGCDRDGDPLGVGRARQRIGGDEQSISSQRTHYSDVTFKHLLLPVWLMAYRYKEKSYRVIINAVTGEVSGERPYSLFKIMAAVLTIAAIVGVIVALNQSR